MGLLRTLIAGVLLTVASVASGGQYSEAAPRADASEMAAFFHDDLAPYGKWVDHRIYGIVWVPDSGATRLAPLHSRPLDMDLRLRLVLGFARAIRLGHLSLRPLGAHVGLRLGMGSGFGVGTGLG